MAKTITWLIGNGFDLNLGLKTRWTDFYEYYKSCNTTQEIEIIKSFKETIEKGKPNYINWSDFEIQLGKHTKEWNTYGEARDCWDDFIENLGEYLEKEQEQFVPSDVHIDSFVKGVTSFYDYLPKNSKDILQPLIKAFVQTDNIIINFISFNYTNTLQRLIDASKDKLPEKWKFGTVINIHGKTNSSPALGVDNPNQILNEKLRDSQTVRMLVKPQYNAQLVDAKRQGSATSLLNASNIICTYGMSLGDSDLTWRNILADCCKTAQKNKPIALFVYDSSIAKKRTPIGRADIALEWQNKITKNDGKNIHIGIRIKDAIDYIFNFNKIELETNNG
jgi:hypothetical protein